MPHSKYLNQCLELAQTSVKSGNHPFGAILVLDNKVVATSQNEVETSNDVTAHAELLLVQKAQRILTSEEICKSTLYTSTEPCAMCAGAIYWVGIRRIVYGCSSRQLFRIAKGGLYANTQDIYKFSTEKVLVTASNKSNSFERQHQHFW